MRMGRMDSWPELLEALEMGAAVAVMAVVGRSSGAAVDSGHPPPHPAGH